MKKATTKKKNANRSNAKKSTGPRSRTGKSKVALNPVSHGLRSLAPVLPGLEDQEDWECHREAVVTQLAPVGAVEHAFAERIALGFWRLARCASAEARLSEITREERYWDAIRNTARKEGYRRGKNEVPEVIWEHLEKDCAELSPIARLWELIETEQDTVSITLGEAEALIFSAVSAEEWNLCLEAFNERFDWPPERAGQLREMMEWFSSQLSDAPQDWMRRNARVSIEAAEAAEKRKERIYRAAVQAGEHSFLTSESAEKITRYETTIHRALLRDTHELQRLQAMRLGAVDAVPIAVDITTDG